METGKETPLDHRYRREREGTIAIVRDTQRQRVYNADAYAPRGRTWGTIVDVQAYIDRLLASALWRRLCPSVTKVVIQPARSAVWSRAHRDPDNTGGTIRLAGGHDDQ